MTAVIQHADELTARYARMARTESRPGREEAWGFRMVQAYLGLSNDRSTVEQLQRIRAIVAAASQVADQRRLEDKEDQS